MTSKKIIDQLQQLDWYVECKTEHELALVLNACLDANINWLGNVQAPFISDQIQQELPVVIGAYSLFDAYRLYWEVQEDFDAGGSNLENITDWFFEELRNE
ncbi:hypothetical protein GQ597_01905 [Gilliamella sp. Pra-s65]|uniref:hypothetical protein n=1 Tax=unclassified Gilliamella TaxID=2685620 RepID=UPI001365FCC9|nr:MULTISPECIES: hypothetical protein [unclassified Gilliamella]MWN89468.1 hypothetical protein [Gilliamella sp. Pra-s65]MWP72780.1 hypothetical protein [Gilliamella sp. Pra-s52]